MKLIRLLAVGAMVGLLGCGASTSKVTGKVTHKGKNLICGTVSFHYPDNSVIDGPIDPNGVYSIHLAKPGDVTITVSTFKPQPPDPRAAGRGAPATTAAPLDPNLWFPIPEKYGDPAQSGKKATVKGGTSTIDIDLE